MRPTLARAELLQRNRARLGEGPVWDVERQVLWWVDILRGALHSINPASLSQTSYNVGQPVGCVAIRTDGGLIAGVRDGFAHIDPDNGSLELKWRISAQPEMRMNDGKCDRAGRFWAGTMAEDGSPVGTLFRLDPGGTPQPILSNLGIPNGIDWSPDDRIMYFVDSKTGGIDSFLYDSASGEISERRRFVDIPRVLGVPDGLTVDANGAVWVALCGGGRVHSYRPDGSLARIIQVPASRVTSCVFGGTNLDVLYITTSCAIRGVQLVVGEPLAGSLFACRPGTNGIAANKYGG